MGTSEKENTKINWTDWKKYDKDKLVEFAKKQHNMTISQATSYANIVLRYRKK